MEWYYLDNQKQQVGPIDEADIKSLVANGTMKKTTLVWNENLENWLPARDSSLGTLFPASKTPPPTPNPAPAKSPPHMPDPTAALGKDENALLDDFSKAEYGNCETYSIFPNAKKSVSGKIFIFGGGCAGFLFLGLPIFYETGKHGGIGIPLLFAALGAYAGKFIHKAVSSGIKSKRK
ncbi:MAG: DUF4339 domain-containing protein [bacterium]